jgi:hypothetical protein
MGVAAGRLVGRNTRATTPATIFYIGRNAPHFRLNRRGRITSPGVDLSVTIKSNEPTSFLCRYPGKGRG